MISDQQENERAGTQRRVVARSGHRRGTARNPLQADLLFALPLIATVSGLENQGEGSASLVVGAAVIGAATGWVTSGPFAAVAIGTGAAVAVGVVVAARRMRQVGKALDGPTPDVSQLPAKQALAALSAATGGSASFDSPQMRALDGVAATAEHDPEAALREAERARDQFPRSPLVTAEVARRCTALERHDAAASNASDAIRLALDGGMNPMAAKLLAEFETYRDDFSLTTAHRERLAGAALAAGDVDAAAWCRAHDKDADV